MALEPFLKNPPSRSAQRRLVAFGFRGRSLNPKRRRRKSRKGKNPPTAVFFPAHKSTLFRVAKSGRWGHKRKKAKSLHRKRRASPALKESPMKRSHRKKTRRAKSHRRRRQNPVAVVNRKRSRRSRRSYRRNPLISMGKLGLPPVREIVWLSAGAIAARMLVPRALTMLPMLSANGYIRGASRVAIAAVASLLAGKVLKGNAKPFIYGVLANQVPEAVNDVAAQAGIKLGLEEAENELSLGTYYGNANRPALAAPGVGMYTGMEEAELGEVEVG